MNRTIGPHNRRTCHMFLRKIDRNVRDHFKAFCAHKGVSMTREIEKMMKEAARKHADADR